MKMCTMAISLDSNESLLLKTVVYALASGMNHALASGTKKEFCGEADFQSVMDAIFIGACEVYKQFKDMPSDESYDEHDWAAAILQNAVKYANIARAGDFSGSYMELRADD